MKIGILGGTFDPVHRGHIALAEAAKHALGLDEVVLMPAARNPLKLSGTRVSDDDRLAMLELAIRGREGLGFSDLEITRGGRSYAVDTLEELKLVMPHEEFWFLMGSDVLRELDEWKNPQRLAKLCRFAVVARPPLSPDHALRGAPRWAIPYCDVVPFAPLDISSSDLRERLERGRPLNGFLPETVEAYILKRRLYRAPIE